MLRQATIARAALLAALAGPTLTASAAEAASASIKGKCYVAYPAESEQAAFGEPIPVDIEELTPGREVRLALEVKGVQTSTSPMLTADKRGNLAATLDLWTTGMGNGPTKGTDARVVVRDFWLGTELAAASVQVANVGFLIDMDTLSITTRRRWFISGLSEISKRNTYYAHYFVNGKKTARAYLGKTQDRCGFLRLKKVTYPGPPSKVPSKFEVRVQASPTFRAKEPYIAETFVKVGAETPPPAPAPGL